MGVQDDVLGALVVQPNYSYAVARKLGHEHARTAVYETIKRLLDLGFIERVEMPEARRERKWYRATSVGQARHAKLVAKALQHRDDLLLGLRHSSVSMMGAVLDEYETLLHRQIQSDPFDASDHGYGDGLLGRLLAREREKVLAAQLSWLAEAREMIADGLSTA